MIPWWRKCILILLSFLSLSAYGQDEKEKIRILNADKFYFNEKESRARVLEGNVQIAHGEAIMYCNKAYLFEEDNVADAVGRVHINMGDTLNLYGDSLHYDGRDDYASVRGNIRLVDREMTLVTDTLDYDMEEKTAVYRGGGVITSTENDMRLTSKTGIYHSETRRMKFQDSVRLESEDFDIEADTLYYSNSTELVEFAGPTYISTDSTTIYCEDGWYSLPDEESIFQGPAQITSGTREIVADTIHYFQQTGFAELFNHISIIDTAESLELYGHFGTYEQKSDQAMITDSALFIQRFDDDELHLHADTLRSDYDSIADTRTLYAFYSVRFYKNDIQGTADSLVYAESDSLLELFGDPILWNEDNQLSADTIRIRTYDGAIQRLYLQNASFIISKADTTGYNQIKGRDMEGFFTDNKLSKVVVTGNGQTIYYAGEEGKEKIGLNRADCSDILIYLEEDAISTISFITEPESVLLPMDQITTEDEFLKDFHWDEHLRPNSPEDLFHTRASPTAVIPEP